jgi:hypothetical protein
LADELKDKINKHFPGPDDIGGDDGERNKTSFLNHAKILFPTGCKFASYVQLKEDVNLFLKVWSASGSIGSSKITCTYGKPSKATKPSTVMHRIRNNIVVPP